MEIVSRLRSLVESVQDDPTSVRVQATETLKHARTPEVVALATWALGLAARELHDLDGADDALGRAAAAAREGGLPSLEGEILSSRALVLAYRGDAVAALAALDLADGLLEGGAAARNQMQRALILTRQGRLTEALDLYEQALPVMRSAGDETGEVRLLLNRSVVLIWQGADRAATADLERALAIARRRGQSLQIAACAQNLGFVLGRLGDVPAALELFGEAEMAYRQLGDESGRAAVVLKDRAEVLAAAGLVHDALVDVDSAISMLESAGNVMDAAEARLTAARLAAIADDPHRSLDDASVAGRSFQVQGRNDWVLQADLVAYAATVDLGQGTPDHGRRLADELDMRGWSLEAQEARLSAATAAIRQGRVGPGIELLEMAAGASTSAVQRVQAHQARALGLTAMGEAGRARAEVRLGLEELDRHRATLGSIELRARVAARARDLIRLGLELAVDGGDAVDVLETIESWRAASLRFPPVHPPDDDALAEDLGRIRMLDAEIRQAQGEGRSTADLVARRSEVEGRVRRRSLVTRGAGAGDPQALVADTIGALGESQLCAYFVDRGRLGAVVVSDGEARLTDIGDAADVADLTDGLVFMLHRMATSVGSEASLRAAAAAFDDGAERLASLLLPGGDRPLVLIPTGVLHRLPWQALAPRRPMTVVPSLGSWRRAQARWEPVDRDSMALLVAGPGLPGAWQEVTDLLGAWVRGHALTGEDATVDGVLAELGSADVVHLAAHGEFRADNPLFSSLLLYDGPLTVYDLERVRRMPSTVVVPSCDIAVSEVARADELLGFTAALLALGVCGLVAPVVPIPDRATAPMMMDLHDRLRRGEHVDHALSSAVTATDPSDLGQRAVRAAFVAFGV